MGRNVDPLGLSLLLDTSRLFRKPFWIQCNILPIAPGQSDTFPSFIQPQVQSVNA